MSTDRFDAAPHACLSIGPVKVLIAVVAIGGASQQAFAQNALVDALQGLATTPPETSVGTVIGIVCPEGIAAQNLQRDCNQMAGAALSDDPALNSQAGNALSGVTPDQAGLSVDAALTSVVTQTGNIGARLATLRHGAVRSSSTGLTYNFDGKTISADEFAKLYGLDPGSGGAASGDTAADFGRLGVFVNGTFRFGNKDQTDLEAGFDFDTNGVTIGADYRVTNNLALGGAFGYMRTDVDLDAAGGSLDTNGYSFSLYGTYYPTDKFYVDGSATYGWNDFDQNRNIRYAITNSAGVQTADVNQTMSTDFDGSQWDIALGTGFEVNNGAWTYGPVSRLQYINADVDGYQENASAPGLGPGTDGSGWTVGVDDQSFKSLTFSMGLYATYAISQSWGVLLPQARFDWVHEFKGEGELVTGRFLGDPSRQSFQFPTDAADRNYYPLGVGMSAVFGEGKSAYAYYQAILGYRNLTDNTFNVGLRLEY